MRRPFPLITLVTDFGLQDEYVGVMKGVILRINPSVQIVDLSHSVEAQDIFGAAYILFSAYKYFPPGTVHVVVVDPGVGSNRRIVCLEGEEHLFLAPDNGVLNFLVEKAKPKRIIEVTNRRYFLPEVSNTFHGRDIFAPVAAHIVSGIKPEELGGEISEIEKFEIPRPVLVSKGTLNSEVIYIDHFGNIITNVDINALKEVISYLKDIETSQICLADEKLSIVVSGREIKKINKSYSDVEDGELIAIFGSSGYLEIAVNKNSAKRLLNVKKGDKIVICYQ